MRKLALGRIIGLLIAVLGIGVSIWWAYEAVQINSQFDQWLDARPMKTSIDLSQTGEITVPFHQTCSISHGEAIYFQCDLDDEIPRDPKELLNGLSGSVTIKDSSGNAAEDIKISKETVYSINDEIILAEMRTFQNGEYFATVRIDSAAPALAGKQQTIYAKYQLCGLERMPAVITGFFSFGAGIIGLIATACVVPGLWRYGLWRRKTDGKVVDA